MRIGFELSARRMTGGPHKGLLTLHACLKVGERLFMAGRHAYPASASRTIRQARLPVGRGIHWTVSRTIRTP